MKYTEEIFNILSKGGFISSNSVSTQVKRLYDAIEEDLPDYYDYYKGIGFYLEGGDGYYYFTRKESKVDLERKLEAIQKWIDYLSFLKTYHSAFGPGFLFRAADIEIQIGRLTSFIRFSAPTSTVPSEFICTLLPSSTLLPWSTLVIITVPAIVAAVPVPLPPPSSPLALDTAAKFA